MSRKNKTENNLQSIWNDLDKAYELIERSLESVDSMNTLEKDVKEEFDNFDITVISHLKQCIEIELENIE